MERLSKSLHSITESMFYLSTPLPSPHRSDSTTPKIHRRVFLSESLCVSRGREFSIKDIARHTCGRDVDRLLRRRIEHFSANVRGRFASTTQRVLVRDPCP